VLFFAGWSTFARALERLLKVTGSEFLGEQRSAVGYGGVNRVTGSEFP